MLSLVLLKKIASLLLIMLFGFVTVKMKLLTAEDSNVLSKLALYVISPCMILNVFQDAGGREVFANLGIALILAAVIHLLFIGITMLIRKPLKLQIVEQASIEYPNFGNLIIPLVTAMYGSEMVVYTVPFICVTNVLQWTHLYSLMRQEKKVNIKKMLTNINVVCIIISIVLLLFNLHFPAIIKDSLASMSDMIGPVSVFITGMLLGAQDLKKIFGNKRAYFTAALRLIVFPTIVLLLLKAFNISLPSQDGDKALMVLFVGVCSCSGTTVVSMSKLYGQNPEYASSINVITLISTIITIPLMVFIYQSI